MLFLKFTLKANVTKRYLISHVNIVIMLERTVAAVGALFPVVGVAVLGTLKEK